MTSSIESRLREAMRRHVPRKIEDFPGRTNDVHAGVLVPIVGTDEPRVVLTERPRALRRHGGEICFPGGRPEPEDVDLLATALREAHEEIGLQEPSILGGLSSIPLLTSNHRLHPFVSYSPEAELVPNPDEVARLVTYSLDELYGRPHIDAIPFDNGRMDDLAPVFETGGRLLFGATAYVLYELLVALSPAFGKPAPPRKSGRFDWPDVVGG